MPKNFVPSKAFIIGLGQLDFDKKVFPCSLIEGQVLITPTDKCNKDMTANHEFCPKVLETAFCAGGSVDQCRVSCRSSLF